MKRIVAIIIAVTVLAVLSGSFYIVRMTEMVIITQFGDPVGEPVTDAGLHFKAPFIQVVNRFEKRVLEWDGRPLRMPTRDKVYLEVSTFARWRIVDPYKFFVGLRDERTALSRLDGMIGGATQAEVAKHDLIELIRTDKERKTPIAEAIPGTPSGTVGLPTIKTGRSAIAEAIRKDAAPRSLSDLGIELMDVRFKRINYGQDVQEKIFTRMSSERGQIAERFRAEGLGEAARIGGERERELKRIESEAYRKVQEIKGKADAEAVRIYATAFNSTPEAAEFFNFTRTLETYSKVMDAETTLVLSTDSDLYRLMKTMTPAHPITPAAAPAPAVPAPAVPPPVVPQP
jgi:modulator of FtsH protease HflC